MKKQKKRQPKMELTEYGKEIGFDVEDPGPKGRDVSPRHAISPQKPLNKKSGAI